MLIRGVSGGGGDDHLEETGPLKGYTMGKVFVSDAECLTDLFEILFRHWLF